MAKRLREVGFARAAGTDDQHRDVLGEIAAGGELVHERAVELGQALEVELLERLAGAKGGASQPQCELLLLAPRDFILDEQGKELGIGELAVEGLAVAGFERIEDAKTASALALSLGVR
jgi:hypothetical protein